jgi:hypothetical protein
MIKKNLKIQIYVFLQISICMAQLHTSLLNGMGFVTCELQPNVRGGVYYLCETVFFLAFLYFHVNKGVDEF